MRRSMLVAAAAVALAGCHEQESENQRISYGIKLIGNAALQRGCISNEERSGLFVLNNVLEERKSPHRIVLWDLPTAPCKSQK
jgi:hypothetical protein